MKADLGTDRSKEREEEKRVPGREPVPKTANKKHTSLEPTQCGNSIEQVAIPLLPIYSLESKIQKGGCLCISIIAWELPNTYTRACKHKNKETTVYIYYNIVKVSINLPWHKCFDNQ